MTSPEFLNRFYRMPSPLDLPLSYQDIDDLFETYKVGLTEIVTENPDWNVVSEHIDVEWRTRWVEYTASSTDYKMQDVEVLLDRFREYVSPFIVAYHVDQVISHPENAGRSLRELLPIMKKHFEALHAWPCLIQAIDKKIGAYKLQHEQTTSPPQQGPKCKIVKSIISELNWTTLLPTENCQSQVGSTNLVSGQRESVKYVKPPTIKLPARSTVPFRGIDLPPPPPEHMPVVEMPETLRSKINSIESRDWRLTDEEKKQIEDVNKRRSANIDRSGAEWDVWQKVNAARNQACESVRTRMWTRALMREAEMGESKDPEVIEAQALMKDLEIKRQEDKKSRGKEVEKWIWMTIYPSSQEDLGRVRRYIKKCVQKVWIGEYYICFEQRSRRCEELEINEDIDGLHVHILFEYRTYKASRVKEMTDNTLEGLKGCRVWYNKGGLSRKRRVAIVEYVRGNKTGVKQPYVEVDRVMRAKHGLAELYTRENIDVL